MLADRGTICLRSSSLFFVSLPPHSSLLFYLLTISGHRTRALQQLSEATARGWATLGATASSMELESEASRCFSKALMQHGDNAVALIGLGNMLKSQGSYKQAVEVYQRALESTPEDGATWAELAYCFLMLNDLPSSYSSYEHALHHIKSPKNPHLWYGIGLLYSRYGIHGEAIDAFDACLKIDPDFELKHEVRFRLAIMAKKEGRIDEALEAMLAILPVVDDPSWQCDVLSQIGHVHELRRDAPAAKSAYLKAIDLNQASEHYLDCTLVAVRCCLIHN